MTTKIIQGDCLEVLKKMPAASANCCVTSPPYWGLRDYGVEGQLGLEKTPEEYVAKMVEVFCEVRRVLRDDGTLWLNLGDSYAVSGKGAWDNKNGGQKEVYIPDSNSPQCHIPKIPNGLKPKDLVGIPWMVAFALRADGWYLRQDIIWHKPNPMPESVTDRCTKAHEYMFLMSKSARYYYDADAIKEACVYDDPRIHNPDFKPPRKDRDQLGAPSRGGGPLNRKSWNGSKFHDGKNLEVHPNVGLKRNTRSLRVNGNLPGRDDGGAACNKPGQETRNKRSVWTVATSPYFEAHFATFPPKLITPCILAGCPGHGTVLDPFGGSGTTGMVAESHGRSSILIELKPEYIEIANRRTAQQGLGI